MELNNKKVENASNKVSNNELSADKKTINSVNNKELIYKRNSKVNDYQIKELENMLKKEKMKVQLYEVRIEDINKQYNKFQEYKEGLNKNIEFLQESLINKEEKINKLEKRNIEKEDELISLREINLNKENSLIQYKEEISELKETISRQANKKLLLIEEVNTLKNQIEDLEVKLLNEEEKSNESFFKRIFNNKNTSEIDR